MRRAQPGSEKKKWEVIIESNQLMRQGHFHLPFSLAFFASLAKKITHILHHHLHTQAGLLLWLFSSSCLCISKDPNSNTSTNPFPMGFCGTWNWFLCCFAFRQSFVALKDSAETGVSCRTLAIFVDSHMSFVVVWYEKEHKAVMNMRERFFFLGPGAMWAQTHRRGWPWNVARALVSSWCPFGGPRTRFPLVKKSADMTLTNISLIKIWLGRWPAMSSTKLIRGLGNKYFLS